MLYGHPSPLCPSQWTKLPSHWHYDESENNLLSGHLTVCFVSTHQFICLHVFFLTHVCIWNIPISSWEVIKLRPSYTHVHESRWCLQGSRSVFVTRPLWLKFYGRWNTYRVRVCVQHESPCSRFRLEKCIQVNNINGLRGSGMKPRGYVQCMFTE